MCLYKSYPFPFLTLKEKKVYKILYKKGDKYITPCRLQEINLSKEHYEQRAHKNLINLIFSSVIEDGCIHCFYSYIHACSELSFLRDPFYDKTILTTAVIPRFTFYWKGQDRDIAARKIKYKKLPLI